MPFQHCVGAGDRATARRLALAWGVRALTSPEVHDVTEMIEHACRAAQTEGFAKAGETVVIVAGLPFGSTGNTNLMHIARIAG
jgi:pyruvate kinase